VAVHQPGGAIMRAFLNGKPLLLENGSDAIRLQSSFAIRVLNLHFKPVELNEGIHTLEFECMENGSAGFDYIWIKPAK
jgi:hypothetical protein